MMTIPLPGSPREELDTPALLIDLDLLEKNIAALFTAAAKTSVSVRPHLKTGKTPALAYMLLEAGAEGICVAKLGEAEIMVAAGIEDVLITTEVVGPAKLARLMGLVRRHPQVKVVVDSVAGADELAASAGSWGVTVRVLVDVNVGQNRTGVLPGSPAVALAQHVADLPALLLVGVQGYEGHLQHVHDDEERERRCGEAMEQLTGTVAALRASGLDPKIVTTGGTGTWQYCASHSAAGVTEVQPGSFIFMDADYRNAIGSRYANALSVLATVISLPEPGRAVVDAGLKTLSTDSGNPVPKELAGVSYRPGGDEHGILTWNGGEDPGLAIGDKVEIIPSHCDTTINLFDYYLALRAGRLETVWSIDCRGRSQ